VGHLPGADDQARLGEQCLQLGGFPDVALRGDQSKVPFHLDRPSKRSAIRLPAQAQACSM
jgi:hypothetical protein